ncbi:MAG: DNA-binding transcriptional regulator [Akkermansiaceae bacterium]|jgi:LacI family transcriptional regulator|nr:DNA-binding transcriptional regulator [Akkermansiaceae bacterium]MDP4647611.1 DNA-binding transcriptional regulator [Akkermansiaceae bacterium]MDP4722186.1 DNA-binding transcriptional regulator [Akkermansiaceae bacterium]MDP4780370.1 DNA-binding transcriptional regulator [Akkermansiaceae bacterium]MDP4846146.1 DNA-binding transcriptional regulator [Akkermansiaceae bacterium]
MKRIAILVETSLASGREILSGISRYLDERPDWSIFLHVGPLGAMAPEAIRNWQGDGIIARIANEELHELIQAKGLPTVDVLGNVTPLSYPLFKCDDRALGTSVARHFLESGHRNFAFIGLAEERWSIEREEAFSATLSSKNYPVSVFHIDQRPTDHVVTGETFESLKKWLLTLKIPTSLMIASDQFGPIVFEACHQLGLSIPENVSVIGVDNDEPFCNLCRPRLSSVMPDHKRVGYQAAKALGRLMQGKKLPEQVVEIGSNTLHRRQSSDFMAIDDPAVIIAVKYIRENASKSPSLDLVAEAAGLSRTVLQRRFREYLNRTVGDVILREKLRLAREMLSGTDMPIPTIAERSGFTSQEYMNHVFKFHLKTTPKKYRAF